MSPAAVAPLLHAAARIGWTEWTIHWSTVIGLAFLGALYLWRARAGPDPTGGADTLHGDPRATRSSSPPRSPAAWQVLSFLAGLLVIFVSLNGPLHDLSDYYLFSAHMVQHLLLTLVAPPLLLLAIPGWMLRPALRSRPIATLARTVTRPAACFASFNLTVIAWHVPALYNTAVAIHPVHIVQHLTFMAAAVLMWWPILGPLPELPRLSYPGQLLYCFLLSIPMSIVAIYITYADVLLYPGYASAPRLWGLSPMDDQLVGGLIMWIPGGLFFWCVMSVVFFRWAGQDSDNHDGRDAPMPGNPASTLHPPVRAPVPARSLDAASTGTHP
ncbi:MAG: cytochrome c oxidase assembly protein [Gemmatimonadaceae bacterium]